MLEDVGLSLNLLKIFFSLNFSLSVFWIIMYRESYMDVRKYEICYLFLSVEQDILFNTRYPVDTT